MSLREERIVSTLVARLLTLDNVTVQVDPDDEHGDSLEGDRVDVLLGDTEREKEENRHIYPVTKRLTIRGLTQAPETPPDPDTALERAMRNLRIGYALLGRILAAAFPSATAQAYQDDLDGNASAFTWLSHAVHPRADGGNTVAVFVDCDVTYKLHLNAPDK